jgi:AraC-like DNA-binding protein
MSSTPQPVKKVRADALKRADDAWRARVAGGTWAEAADIAGYSDQDNCRRAVRRVFGQLPSPDREEMRNLWRDRHERLWRKALSDVLEGKPGAVVAAVRVAEAATRLDGLGAPTRVSLIDPTQEEIERFLDETLGPRHADEEPDIFDPEDIVDAEVIE